MYYRLFDNDTKDYASTGYNDTSKDDLKASLLSLVETGYDGSKEDWEICKTLPIEELCSLWSYEIEESKTPFPEDEDPGYISDDYEDVD